jgi:hypothetical protein
LTPVEPSHQTHPGGTLPAIVVSATAQSCYDATFPLPTLLPAGEYTLEVRSNLPSATWVLPRDPDQHTITIQAALTPYGTDPAITQCNSAAGKTYEVHDRTTLFTAVAAANALPKGKVYNSPCKIIRCQRLFEATASVASLLTATPLSSFRLSCCNQVTGPR